VVRLALVRHSMSARAALKAAFLDPTSTHARLLLKCLSLGAGGFLVFAGCWGAATTPIMGGGLIYFVGALYAIVFGIIVLTVELKDKNRLVSAFYHWIDTYLKFLTLQVCHLSPPRCCATDLTHVHPSTLARGARAPSTLASGYW
jgi:hypothetical protein